MEAMFAGIILGLTAIAAILGLMALAVKVLNKRNAQMRNAQRVSTKEANHKYLRSIGYMK